MPPHPTPPQGWCCRQVTVPPRHHYQRPNTYRPTQCTIHGQSLACCWLPKAFGYTLTCIDADGARHTAQTGRILNALHPSISFLVAPTADRDSVQLHRCLRGRPERCPKTAKAAPVGPHRGLPNIHTANIAEPGHLYPWQKGTKQGQTCPPSKQVNKRNHEQLLRSEFTYYTKIKAIKCIDAGLEPEHTK